MYPSLKNYVFLPIATRFFTFDLRSSLFAFPKKKKAFNWCWWQIKLENCPCLPTSPHPAKNGKQQLFIEQKKVGRNTTRTDRHHSFQTKKCTNIYFSLHRKNNCTMLFYKLRNPFVAFSIAHHIAPKKIISAKESFFNYCFFILYQGRTYERKRSFFNHYYTQTIISLSPSPTNPTIPQNTASESKSSKKPTLPPSLPFPPLMLPEKYTPKKTSTPRFPKIRIRSAHRKKKTKIRKKCSQLRWVIGRETESRTYASSQIVVVI